MSANVVTYLSIYCFPADVVEVVLTDEIEVAVAIVAIAGIAAASYYMYWKSSQSLESVFDDFSAGIDEDDLELLIEDLDESYLGGVSDLSDRINLLYDSLARIEEMQKKLMETQEKQDDIIENLENLLKTLREAA